MAVREVLLTLLAVEPNYGFRLHTEIVARLPHRRALNVGQTYTTLERARKAGLITSAGLTDDNLPLFALTPSGEGMVTAWLAGVDGTGAADEETADRLFLLASLGALLPHRFGEFASVQDAELARWRERSHSPHSEVPLSEAHNARLRLLAAATAAWVEQFGATNAQELTVVFSTEKPRRGRPRIAAETSA